MNEELERDRFEKWVIKHWVKPAIEKTEGEYSYGHIETLWRGWCARAKHEEEKAK